MKIILEAKDLLSITDSSEVKPEIEAIAKFSEWKKKDAKSKMLITTALEFKYLQQIVNCQTSAEMWKKLSTIYELKSETNKYLLQQRFFEYKMNPNDNIATHISKVETQAQQMKDLAWDSVSSEEKTLENLTARLLKEESLQDHWDSSGNFKPDNALMTFSKFNRNSTASNKQQQHQQSIKDKKKNTHCGYCKKKGHWWKECYKRKEEQKGQQPSSSARDDSCAFSAETSAFLAETKDSWIADSGATDHMTFRREWFSTFEEIPEGVHPVCLGDGKQIYAKEIIFKNMQLTFFMSAPMIKLQTYLRKLYLQKVYHSKSVPNIVASLPRFKMDKLKKACETKKRTLESVIAEADGELGKQEPSLEMLMSLRPKLLRCKDRFLIASDCLIEQLIKADREDEEIEDVDIVQANLFGRSEGVLQKMEQLLAKPTVDRESIVSGGNEGKSNLHRLPKLELPKFGGQAREWLQFWSAFQSVHDDDSISACVKFQYLQNCMIKGSVSEEIVSSFPNSAANYPLAISTLKERFGREDMLVEVYVRDLIAIILENAHGRNTTSFSTVYVRLSSQLRALGSLGVTTDKCAAILYPMVESALPEDLFVAWERTRHHHKPDEDGKHNSSEVLLEKLMEFLKHEVEGSERMRLARQPFSSSYPSQFNRDKPPKPKTSVATAASLINGENKPKVVRAMLDSGSQNSYVLEQTASEVGLTMLGKKEVVHLLFGGVKSRPQQHKRYRIYISDVDSKYNCNFEVQDCSTICSAMPSAQPTEWMTELRSKGIDLDVYRSNTEIELLLEADVYAKLLTGKKIELESGPVALETKLGWTSVMQQYKIFGD
ncbi:hypothetical protein LAZ67_1003765 [Cordylochernes scorpioides]|uniref:Retrovirus-related Pol polyprotein from transposon TNT 1-94-like beta-barrel domain-containing protein n=1 Tax=Cordylochernes scorpioides TaxID=51811 RepID=A0ABY6K029_9ARAC|nr:hypothetical protein LAZ67_1003765 [Cordylochernes scorpioides]